MTPLLSPRPPMSDRADTVTMDTPHGQMTLVIHQPNARLLEDIRRVMDFYHPPQEAKDIPEQ